MFRRLKYAWSVLWRGVWYHVEIMDEVIHTDYGKFTGRRIYSTQKLEEANFVVDLHAARDQKVRINVVLGIPP